MIKALDAFSGFEVVANQEVKLCPYERLETYALPSVGNTVALHVVVIDDI